MPPGAGSQPALPSRRRLGTAQQDIRKGPAHTYKGIALVCARFLAVQLVFLLHGELQSHLSGIQVPAMVCTKHSQRSCIPMLVLLAPSELIQEEG